MPYYNILWAQPWQPWLPYPYTVVDARPARAAQVEKMYFPGTKKEFPGLSSARKKPGSAGVKVDALGGTIRDIRQYGRIRSDCIALFTFLSLVDCDWKARPRRGIR